MERHTVSRLIGAPPGYVGFDQGGLLTDGVDQHPHCVVLLDEIEKAHPDLFNILLQVMDHGKLTDHNGKKVDFRNVILIMTTNAGASDAQQRGDRLRPTQARRRRRGGDQPAVHAGVPQPPRRDHPVRPLPPAVVRQVVQKFVLQLEAQLADRGVTIDLSPEAADWLAEKGYDERMGARPLGRVIQEHIKKPLADEVLFGKLKKGGTVRVTVETKETGETGLKLEALADEVPVQAEEGRAGRRPRRAKPRPSARWRKKPAVAAEAKPSSRAARTAPSAAWCRSCRARADHNAATNEERRKQGLFPAQVVPILKIGGKLAEPLKRKTPMSNIEKLSRRHRGNGGDDARGGRDRRVCLERRGRA